MSLETLFFQLLQVAIGKRKKLDLQPSSNEWALLFEMAKKHALVGVAFLGVTKLIHRQAQEAEGSNFGASIGIPEVIYLKWLGLTAKTAQRNKELTTACAEVSERFEKDGFHSCVLKGQSNLVYYPEELGRCRTCGDIDAWLMLVECGLCGEMKGLKARRKKLVKYVDSISPEQKVIYHHVDCEIGNNSVEVHFTPSWMKCPWHNARVQRFFEDEWYHVEKCKDGFCVPSLKMNVVYQLMHIYRHLFNEGIGLRQVLDYYYVVRALHVAQGEEFSDRRASMGQWAEGRGRGVPSTEEVCKLLKHFGLYNFAGAVMWVLQKVFAMPSEYLICKPCADSGKFLLSEIMEAGNFGKFDKRMDGEYASSSFLHLLYKAKRNLRLFTFFPSEVIWAPYFFYVQNWGSWRIGLK